MKVLFVCLGNICRSPMAEAVFKDLVKTKSLDIESDSAGTASYHVGSNPDRRSVACCESHGVAVSHKARQLVKEDLDYYDYVLVMDNMNLEDALELRTKSSKATVKLLGSYDPQKTDGIINDPYYGGQEGFEVNFQQCQRSCEAFLNTLK